MISCDVAKDMLPLVAAGDCSDETKLIVDEHVATCASCRAELAMMKDPAVAAERTPEEPGTGEISREMTFEKGFRKIRRMWFASIVCVLCILPLSGLGILGFNDVRGEGYAYSNLGDAITIRAYLECLKNKDYEGAFEYFDIQQMYFAATSARTDQNTFDFMNYFQTTIGGEIYYLSSWNNFDLYSDYSEEGKDVKIWAQVIRDNAMGYSWSPIPKDEFAGAASLVEQEVDEKIMILDFDSDLEDTAYTYIEFVALDGEAYYMPTLDGRTNSPDWKHSVKILPEKIFLTLKKEQEIRNDKEIARMDQYRNLGLDGYTQAMKERYIELFAHLEEKGIALENYSIGTPRSYPDYFDEETQEMKMVWNFNVDLIMSSNPNSAPAQMNISIKDGKISDMSCQFQGIAYDEGYIYIHNISPYPFIFDDTENVRYYTYIIEENQIIMY